MTRTIQRYVPTDQMIQLISDNYSLLQVLSRFGLSLGFGEQTVDEVCQAQGVHTGTFLTVVNLLNRPEEGDARHPDMDGGSAGEKELSALYLPALLDYLKQSHRYFLDFCLPSIRRKLVESIDCSTQNELAFLILRFFDQYVAAVRRHMQFEESMVFPYVENLLKQQSGKDFCIRQFATHHDQIDDTLSELKHILVQYYPASGNNHLLNAVLFDIYHCEQELASHTRVEDHLFVPAVYRLETQVAQWQQQLASDSVTVCTIGSTKDVEEGPEALTQREKEIITCVAKGMINKEIAEALFLSVHTVTTHRKNIARKLKIHSVAGLTIYAIAHQLVELSEVKL